MVKYDLRTGPDQRTHKNIYNFGPVRVLYRMLYFTDLVRKILHLVCDVVLSVCGPFLFRTTQCTIVGVVAHVQLLVHYAMHLLHV